MSTPPKARYVVDEQGETSAVLLDIEEYRRLLEALEELESIRAYDVAVHSDDEARPGGGAGMRSLAIETAVPGDTATAW